MKFLSRNLLVPGLLALAACGGVRHRVRADLAPPRTIAVLPFQGDSEPAVQDAARALLRSRLQNRGYLVPECAWVDRVLSEHRWLRDPRHFDAMSVPLQQLGEALAVDAVAFGNHLDDSRFNFVVLRRHRVGADLSIRLADGDELWSATHAVGGFGGFLLTSGQVFTELRAQGEHGTPMETLSLVDELVADMADTVPMRTPDPATIAPPQINTAAATTTSTATGTTRLIVTANSSANASLRVDIEPLATGVPMVAQRNEPTQYRGAFDLDAGAKPSRLVVHARDAFGRETTMEVSQ